MVKGKKRKKKEKERKKKKVIKICQVDNFHLAILVQQLFHHDFPFNLHTNAKH